MSLCSSCQWQQKWMYVVRTKSKSRLLAAVAQVTLHFLCRGSHALRNAVSLSAIAAVVWDEYKNWNPRYRQPYVRSVTTSFKLWIICLSKIHSGFLMWTVKVHWAKGTWGNGVGCSEEAGLMLKMSRGFVARAVQLRIFENPPYSPDLASSDYHFFL